MRYVYFAKLSRGASNSWRALRDLIDPNPLPEITRPRRMLHTGSHPHGLASDSTRLISGEIIFN
jgi:hypothetical protein